MLLGLLGVELLLAQRVQVGQQLRLQFLRVILVRVLQVLAPGGIDLGEIGVRGWLGLARLLLLRGLRLRLSDNGSSTARSSGGSFQNGRRTNRLLGLGRCTLLLLRSRLGRNNNLGLGNDDRRILGEQLGNQQSDEVVACLLVRRTTLTIKRGVRLRHLDDGVDDELLDGRHFECV